MTSGSILEFKGTNSDNHGLQMQAQKWATIKLEGSDSHNSATTVAGSEILIGGYSVQLASGASNYAAGDWATIYRSGTSGDNTRIGSAGHQYNKSDEGFIVHDVCCLFENINIR